MTFNVTPEMLYAVIAGASTLGLTWSGSPVYVGGLIKGAWNRVKSWKAAAPAVPTTESEYDSIVAAVRRSQIAALGKPVDVRTAVLAECDAYLATIRALYSEMAK